MNRHFDHRHPLATFLPTAMLCSRLLLSFGLFLLAICSSAPSYAIEDFRAAIKSIVPHIILVRRLDQVSNKPDPLQDVKTEQKAADSNTKDRGANEIVDPNQNLLEALRNRNETIAYQHAFRVTEELIATVDLGKRTSDHRWELLSRDGQWHDLELVGRDNVTKLVVLRGKEEILDKIAVTGPVEGGGDVGTLPSGDLEMGLPTVVVWYEDGAPRAKATMVAATGNVKTRGLAILDHAFQKTQVGAPVLDAQAKLLGVLSVRNISAAERDAERRFELSDVELKIESNGSPKPTEERVREGTLQAAPKTITITADSRGEDEPAAEYVVPTEVLNRLLADVAKSDDPVSLEAGLFGIWLGNGDATIRGLIRGGAAEDADCKKGDKIVSVDGKSVRNDSDILGAIMARRAGDIVTLELQSLSRNAPNEARPATTADSSTTSSSTESHSTIRTVKITMRGIRTRTEKSKPNSEQSQSSSMEKDPESQVRLVGVRDGGARQDSSQTQEVEQQDIEELRIQIEQLLKELSEHDRK